MFRISAENSAPSLLDAYAGIVDPSALDTLSRFCLIEKWSADLDNAVLNLGEAASRFHGLDPLSGRFGLLEFVRCYDPRAAHDIIALFEQAAARERPFHYSAELRSATREKRIVHCFGDFGKLHGERATAGLDGVFLLSRTSFVES